MAIYIGSRHTFLFDIRNRTGAINLENAFNMKVLIQTPSRVTIEQTNNIHIVGENNSTVRWDCPMGLINQVGRWYLQLYCELPPSVDFPDGWHGYSSQTAITVERPLGG